MTSHVRVLHRVVKAPLDRTLYPTRNLWTDLGIRDVNRMKNQSKTVPRVAGAPADRKSGSHRNGRSDSGARRTKMPPRRRKIQQYPLIAGDPTVRTFFPHRNWRTTSSVGGKLKEGRTRVNWPIPLRTTWEMKVLRISGRTRGEILVPRRTPWETN